MCRVCFVSHKQNTSKEFWLTMAWNKLYVPVHVLWKNYIKCIMLLHDIEYRAWLSTKYMLSYRMPKSNDKKCTICLIFALESYGFFPPKERHVNFWLWSISLREKDIMAIYFKVKLGLKYSFSGNLWIIKWEKAIRMTFHILFKSLACRLM